MEDCKKELRGSVLHGAEVARSLPTWHDPKWLRQTDVHEMTGRHDGDDGRDNVMPVAIQTLEEGVIMHASRQ